MACVKSHAVEAAACTSQVQSEEPQLYVLGEAHANITMNAVVKYYMLPIRLMRSWCGDDRLSSDVSECSWMLD